MTSPREVLIVSASPILSAALHTFLERHGIPACCGVAEAEALPGSRAAVPRLPYGEMDGSGSSVVLLATGTWEETAWGLEFLRAHYADRPWLLLMDARLAGAFLHLLACRSCGLVPPSASPTILPDTLDALATGHMLPLAFELTARFAHGVTLTLGGRRIRFPTQSELQCGCAASLGLSNSQIAELLCLGEATVKTHLHHLLQKLEIHSRGQLSRLVQKALAPLPPPFRATEFVRNV